MKLVQFARAFAVVMAAGPLVSAALAEPARPAPLPSCFAALAGPPTDRLVCEHLAWMTDDERAEVQRLTRGYLLDARCTVHVDVEAALVEEALAASDRTIQFPPQPVTCELQTSGGAMTVSGTFAPHLVFKGGFAVQASPGLANITGVNSYLAWPVVAYVNHAPSITSEMAQMINDYRALKSRKQVRN